MQQMTKTQLVASLAEAMQADKKVAAAVLDEIALIVTREVTAGGSVTLPGLGKFSCRERPDRQVRNPATGASSTKAADRAVKFTMAKSLKECLA